MAKSFVFIDGSNLYHRIKSVADFYLRKDGSEFGTIDFDFKGFVIPSKEIQNYKKFVTTSGRLKD